MSLNLRTFIFFFLLLLLYCCQSTTRILVSVVIQHLPGRARHFFIASSRNNICVFFSSKKDLSLSLSLTACVYYSICCSRNIFSPLHTQQPWSTFLTIIGSVVGGQLAHARDILHTSDTLYRHKFLLLKNKKKAAKSWQQNIKNTILLSYNVRNALTRAKWFFLLSAGINFTRNRVVLTNKCHYSIAPTRRLLDMTLQTSNWLDFFCRSFHRRRVCKIECLFPIFFIFSLGLMTRHFVINIQRWADLMLLTHHYKCKKKKKNGPFLNESEKRKTKKNRHGIRNYCITFTWLHGGNW